MVQKANKRTQRITVPSLGEVVRRRSIRLEDYDYASSGAYFVTPCTAHRKPLFGRLVDGRVVENRNARTVRGCWLGLPDYYPHLRLYAFVVMPDHVHGIVVLGDTHRTNSGRAGDPRAGFKPARATNPRNPAKPRTVPARAAQTPDTRHRNNTCGPARGRGCTGRGASRRSRPGWGESPRSGA